MATVSWDYLYQKRRFLMSECGDRDVLPTYGGYFSIHIMTLRARKSLKYRYWTRVQGTFQRAPWRVT